MILSLRTSDYIYQDFEEIFVLVFFQASRNCLMIIIITIFLTQVQIRCSEYYILIF